MARPKGRGRGGPRKRKKGGYDSGSQQKSKEEGLTLEGAVVENLPNAQFRVKLDETDQVILAHVSGKMRKYWIKILVGDRVKVEFSPYDLERARIVYRFRP